MMLRGISPSFSSNGARSSFLIRLLVTGVSLLVLLVALGFPGSETSAIAMAAATALSVYGAVICRANWLLVIPFLFLAYCSYSILCAMYLGLVEQSPYLAFSGTRYAWEGASVMLAFTMGITLLLPTRVSRFPNAKITSPRFNGSIVAVCIIGIIVAAFNLADTTGARMRMTSSFYEYSIIFVIVGLYYASDNKWATAAIVLAVAFRTALDFITGNRVTSLEMLVVLFLMNVSYRVKASKLIIPGLILYVALMTVGSLRGSDFSLEVIAQDFADTFLSNCGAWDGAYSAYHTSLCVLATEQLYPHAERVAQLPAALLSCSVSPVDLVASPTELAGQVYWHMGGTYFPFFFHFYLGLPGVVAASCLLGMLLRRMARPRPGLETAPVLGLVTVWIGATSFRWIQYDLTQLIRGVMLTCIAAGISYIYVARGKSKAANGQIHAAKSSNRIAFNPQNSLHRTIRKETL